MSSKLIKGYLIVCQFLLLIHFHTTAQIAVFFSQQEVEQGPYLQNQLIWLSIFSGILAFLMPIFFFCWLSWVLKGWWEQLFFSRFHCKIQETICRVFWEFTRHPASIQFFIFSLRGLITPSQELEGSRNLPLIPILLLFGSDIWEDAWWGLQMM